jgi:DNA polymerase-3 subunit delta'
MKWSAGLKAGSELNEGTMKFEDMIGQREVLDNLHNSLIDNKVGHAYAFCGPEGIGKRTMAGIFADMLLCIEPSNGKPCGECQACRLHVGGVNPDFRRVAAAGSGIGVDDIRKMLSDIVIRPMYSKRKVYIIEDAGDMTVQAQNCMLKTLEEPPPYAVIILTAARYESLLETIRSRVTRINFRKNSYEEVKLALQIKMGYGEAEAGVIAAWSDGVIGKALEIAGSDEFRTTRDRTINEMEKLRKSGIKGIFEAAAFFEENRETNEIVFDIMETYFRDILVANVTGNENMLINKDKKDIIFNNVRNYSSIKLAYIIGQIAAIRREIKQNANFMLAVENLLIKIVEERAEDLTEW